MDAGPIRNVLVNNHVSIINVWIRVRWMELVARMLFAGLSPTQHNATVLMDSKEILLLWKDVFENHSTVLHLKTALELDISA